ncbi:hypothetical protein CSUI_010837 [Cystoisospora suis]|uniref:Uncharacterized protein n=1 Tax=Cystoisospora suis TaxID=483139 RepID=A0A2C6KG15_9APIC|nr:hypothetical protein CSUI_010837 [Cystoisospora suis]
MQQRERSKPKRQTDQSSLSTSILLDVHFFSCVLSLLHRPTFFSKHETDGKTDAVRLCIHKQLSLVWPFSRFVVCFSSHSLYATCSAFKNRERDLNAVCFRVHFGKEAHLVDNSKKVDLFLSHVVMCMRGARCNKQAPPVPNR